MVPDAVVVVTDSASDSLHRVRDAKGISQARMVELLGLNPFTYYAFERGRRVPTPGRWDVIRKRLREVELAIIPGPKKYERRHGIREVPEGDYPPDTVFAVWPKRETGRRRGKIAVGMVFEDGGVAIRWLRPSDVTPRGALPFMESLNALQDLRVRLLGADVEITWRA